VRAKTQGTPFAEKTEDLMKQADCGAMHGSQSIPRQQADDPRGRSAMAQGGSNPDAEKILARAKTITDNQIAAYKENPWAASAKFQRLPSVPDKPLPSADAVPAYVSQVQPYMSAVESGSGPGNRGVAAAAESSQGVHRPAPGDASRPAG
jgi:hypothetical protein